ncbi:MAG: 3'-5' exonuclease domain-containing protein 2, partial [Muribaculaceae bacterium]|nr:3'-5' exonuclease domain-containing protein 2 [Muribaculaceae bacterium]
MEVKKAASISKQELANLPMVTFDGSITVIDTIEGASEAAEVLSKEKILGFDTETKPAFKRGQTNNVALLPLSSRSGIYLLRLNKI